MNRKTTAILAAAGVLTAGALLALRPHRGDGVLPRHDEPQPPTTTCGAPPPARRTVDAGATSLEAALSGSHVLAGGDGELYLAIDLEARPRAGAPRPRLNVAIVVDRSGSMAGEKLVKAREAARGLVERLAPGDRAAVIQYDDTAEVVVPSIATDVEGKRRLVAAIDALRDDGGTNLHDGLALGRDEILRTIADGHVNRVILLSDGQANVGVRDPRVLADVAAQAADRGVRITTVGLGADYNEDLMAALAEHGRGQYYYVRDAATLDAVFAGELREIQGTVATRAELRLEPTCPGVEIAEVYGYATRRDGRAVTVPLADLAGGERRKLVARLAVAPSVEDGQGLLVATTFRWDEPGGGPSSAERVDVGAVATRDRARVEASADRDVLAKVAQIESALALRRAAEAYERGDQAAAVQAIDRGRAKVAQKAARYGLSAAAAAPALAELDHAGSALSAIPPSAPEAKDVTKRTKKNALDLAKKR